MTLSVELRRYGGEEAEILQDTELFGVNIPRGFITDGASVPRFAYWFMNPYGIGLFAAIKHDYVITHAKYLHEKTGNPKFLRRKNADDEFRKDLIQSGVPKWKASIAWVFVRLYSRYREYLQTKDRVNRKLEKVYGYSESGRRRRKEETV